jgi:integrase
MRTEFRLVKYRGKFAAEWYEAGQRKRVSLRTDDRREATEELRALEAKHEAAQRPERVTVAYAWEGYRKSLGEKPAGVTMGHEWKALGPFFGELSAETITERDCKRYAAERREKGRKDGTIWTELGHLRSALKWAEKQRLIDKAPTIYRPDRPEPKDLRLTKAEVRTFLAACELPHVKLFVTLACTTGARSGAILGLTWDRVDLDSRIIKLADPNRPKTNKGRAVVPINRTLLAALTEAERGRQSKYVIEWGGGKVGSVKKAIKAAGARCGLGWVTPHVFRHSAATHMAEAGRPMSEIAQFLGHSDSRITERVYARFSPNFLRKSADALEFDGD